MSSRRRKPVSSQSVLINIILNIILDKSGSMGPKQADVIGGFNRFLEEQRKAPGRARMILTQFSSTPRCRRRRRAVPIEEMLPLTPDTYTPGGNTALFDAIAQTVGRADADKRPDERVLCLIITDGEENSSRETTLEQVRRIIGEHEARGDWTFAYLGAAPDRWTKETGMSMSSRRSFTVNAAPARAAQPAAARSTGVAPIPWRVNGFRDHTPTSSLFSHAMGDR
jgi:hypothetical protein